jgi:hypothetical protein
MTESPTKSSPPAIVVDALCSLLEAELNSVFRFMDEGSPYLSRATADIRKPLHEMVGATHRRAGALADMIDSLGVVPVPAASVRSSEQYLAFLSLKFLLPKLVTEEKLLLSRYENAARAIPTAPPQVKQLLETFIAEHRNQLAVLEHAAAEIAREKRPSVAGAVTHGHSDAGPSGE